MANRFPLIANSSSNQIQELANADNLDLTGNNVVGVVDITASGNISVGGTLTYEDVTNVDSVGLITARTGIKVLAGGISIVGGGATVAGIATFHDGADIEGFKVEDGQTAATPNGEFNFYLADGHFFRYTGTPGADYYPNFKHSASINLNDRYKKTPDSATIPSPIFGLKKIQPIKTRAKTIIESF